MGWIKRHRDERDADKYAKEYVINDCPINWQINPKRNIIVIVNKDCGIKLCSKSIETIKKAYKKLVKKYHPDYNIGNKEYENKIKEINQAYNDLKEIK